MKKNYLIDLKIFFSKKINFEYENYKLINYLKTNFYTDNITEKNLIFCGYCHSAVIDGLK
jgi:hypothetical protein